MKRKLLSLALTLAMLLTLLPMSASAADTDGSVTVFLSLSHDDQYMVGRDTGEVMALKKITVPYFDLALYGLEKYYFCSESYGSGGGVEPGTAESAAGKVTMLHLFIYATEVYYQGIDPKDAGKGYLKTSGELGTETFGLRMSQSPGSAFIDNIWGYNYNLNYYLNYEYPLASVGWGSTCDQILVRDGDVITLGHFSYSGFSDEGQRGRFHHIEPTESAVRQGDPLKLEVYRDGFKGHSKVDYTPAVYCAPADGISDGDVTKWTYVGTADENGDLTVDTTTLEPGTYLFAMAGTCGTGKLSKYICSTPGGGMATVLAAAETPLAGDLNGDGQLSALDAAMVYRHVMTKFALTQRQQTAADVNGDGSLTAVDAALLYRKVNNTLSKFPGE